MVADLSGSSGVDFLIFHLTSKLDLTAVSPSISRGLDYVTFQRHCSDF